MEKLPLEIQQKIFLYMSHPIADLLRPHINEYEKCSVYFINPSLLAPYPGKVHRAPVNECKRFAKCTDKYLTFCHQLIYNDVQY